ncbi:MAG: fatty acid desaturase [Pseudomonadota bacterium]
MWQGVLEGSLWQLIGFTVLVAHLTLMSVTVYLHRAMAHRAIELHPALAHVFRFILWVATGMRTVEWVAVHRKHHARCETDEDPHSPVVFGLQEVLLRGAELYAHEAAKQETIEKFGHGCPTDWIERKLYTPYLWLGIVLMLLVNLALFGLLGFSTWAVQMLCIPVLAAGVINGIGHHTGYRNYESEDASTNVVPWGVVIVGEELHNNHHAYPSSAKFSIRPWEFDLGWLYIRLFCWLGLAKVRRVAPTPVYDQSKTAIDLDTVKAIVASKLHVMEHYASRVIKPVHRETVVQAGKQARSELRRARSALIDVDAFLDDAARARLQNVLIEFDALRTVYEARERFAEIWQIASASNERLVQALQEWCREAENSGIEALEEFAVRLRGYSLQPARV